MLTQTAGAVQHCIGQFAGCDVSRKVITGSSFQIRYSIFYIYYMIEHG